MKRAVTFDLPPSPQCVIQRRTVVIRREDALKLLHELSRQLVEPNTEDENDSASAPRD